MTLNAHSVPAFPLAPLPAPQPLRPVRPTDELFGVLLLEAVTPVGDQALPVLPDWELRAWPVARLGDVTLEARPLRPWLGPDDLRAALIAGGWTPLGPVRRRHGPDGLPSMTHDSERPQRLLRAAQSVQIR